MNGVYAYRTWYVKCRDETFVKVEKANEEDFENIQRKYVLETFF